jgi:hypothetical protein
MCCSGKKITFAFRKYALKKYESSLKNIYKIYINIYNKVKNTTLSLDLMLFLDIEVL